MKAAAMTMKDRRGVDYIVQGVVGEIEVSRRDAQTKIGVIRKRSNRGEGVMYKNIDDRRQTRDIPLSAYVADGLVDLKMVWVWMGGFGKGRERFVRRERRGWLLIQD